LVIASAGGNSYTGIKSEKFKGFSFYGIIGFIFWVPFLAWSEKICHSQNIGTCLNGSQIYFLFYTFKQNI